MADNDDKRARPSPNLQLNTSQLKGEKSEADTDRLILDHEEQKQHLKVDYSIAGVHSLDAEE